MIRCVRRQSKRIFFERVKFLSSITPVVNNFINGKLEESDTKEYFPVYNPATQDLICQVPKSTEKDLQRAVEGAHKAFNKWKDVPVQQRQRVFYKLQHLIREQVDNIAQVITAEQGKTLSDSKGDVFRGLEVVETSCSAGAMTMGETAENLSRHIDTYSYRQPLGVCAGISPFNFPAMIPLWMFPIALATGNTMVLKPSERVPGAAMYLARLAQEAGVPDGVLQVVHGGMDAANFLCDSPLVRAVSFVGGNAAGNAVATRASANGKRVQAGLGAKNHAVILPDANKTATLAALVGAAFGAAGQRCMSLSVVIFVGESRRWMADLVAQAAALKVGPGWDPLSEVGPLISPEAKLRVLRLVAEGVTDGASIELDGRDVLVPGFEKGNFVGPTVLSGVQESNRVYREEVFGPVLLCMEADSLQQAVSMVNANPYGNGSSVFTSSGAAARFFQREVQAGQLGVNVPIPVAVPLFSFSGAKESFRGDLHFYGRSGFHFYTQTKTITTRWEDDGGGGGGGGGEGHQSIPSHTSMPIHGNR